MNYKLWYGNQGMFSNEIFIETFHDMTIGIYGGYDAVKNEDGYFLLAFEDGTRLSVLFDAHTTNESVVYVIEQLESRVKDISELCSLPISKCLSSLQSYLVDFMMSEEVTSALSNLRGETAILYCLQKGNYLWWLSIGDNSLYVFHKEFNELGQYRVNQRVFYQWLGNQNSLTLDVPCYTTGTLQLREGENKVLMLTDGVLEIEGRPFENNQAIESIFQASPDTAVNTVLKEVKNRNGRDNATLITWSVYCNHKPLRPSRLKK